MSNTPVQDLTELNESAKPATKRLFQKIRWQPKMRFLPSLRSKLSKLTLSQWMYLFACIIMMSNFKSDVKYGDEVLWVGAIAGIGLVRELWHIFNRIWQQLLGKGLILVLYAATANFALAISALKINVITGVEPTPFVFTLGFTTLIMLPFWLLVSSILFFTLALVASNFWLIIGALLRLVRIKVKVHWEDKTFIFTTMLLRIILIPYVIMSLMYVLVPYAQQIEIFENSIAVLKSEKEQVAQQQESEDSTADETTTDNVKISFNNRPFELPINEEGQIRWLDKMIAMFIYNFETYPRSACKKSADQRSLSVDENIVLLVSEDDSPLGYQFSVAPCVGDYPEPAVQ